jgi:protocatechuate 3,4-dioxygenase beta subunit
MRLSKVIACLGLLLLGGALEGDDAKGSSVRVRVHGPDGRPVESVYLTLWRRLDPGVKLDSRGILYEPFVWEDRAAGKTWERFHSWSPHYPRPKPLGFTKLPAGEYRLSVVTYQEAKVPDPTPAGVSDAFLLDGQEAREITVALAGDTSLRVRVVEAGSGKPLEHAALRLQRADGLPIVHGHGSGNFYERTDAKGEVHYRRLVPGAYQVQALGRRASAFGEQDFETLPKLIAATVTAGRENTLEVALPGQTLSAEEIDRRWPFIVTGTVTDEKGRPLPGVEVMVHSGRGTLFLSGRATSGADGKYTLRFRPAVAMAGGRMGGQAATVTARRAGLFEQNLSRQGNLITADRPLNDEERKAYGGYADVIVARTPYRLDFAMPPAAQLEGRLLDGENRPLAGRTFWIVGEELPPSQSVLATVKTDGQGLFKLDSVPLRTYGFAVQGKGRDEVRSEAMRFEKAGTYRVELIDDRRPGEAPRLQVKVLARP